MVKDEKLARSVIQLIRSIDPILKIYSLAHSPGIEICKEEGMRPVKEGFADRRYQTLQQLRSRSQKDAVIYEPDEVLSQIDDFINGKVKLYNEKISPISIETICLHSDTLGAVQLSKEIHHFLLGKYIAIG